MTGNQCRWPLGAQENFVAAKQPSITEHPPIGIAAKKGEWANYQVAFVPDAHDNVVGVAYTLWTGEEVWAARRKAMSQGCTMVVYGVNVSAPHG